MYKYVGDDPDHEASPVRALTKPVQKLCPNQALTFPTPPIPSWLLCRRAKALAQLDLEVGR